MVVNGFVSNVICMIALSPPVAIHSLFGFPARFLGALTLAAVPSLLALRQGDFALGDAVAEVYPQGNYGQTFGLSAASELVDFILVQQKLARAQRLVVPRATRHVLGDVSVDQPRTRGLEVNIGFTDIRLSFAKGFDLGAVEHEAGLIALEQMVVVRSGAVLRHNLLFAFFGLLGLFGWFVH